MEKPASQFFGVEFHPEANHTENGTQMLRNFVFRVCGARKELEPRGFIAKTVETIRKQDGRRSRNLRA